MKEYYHLVDITDKTNPAGGQWIAAWQHVKDGQQVKFCDENLVEIVPPAVYEARLVNTDQYFAPGVLRDPSNAYTPPSMAEYLAAVANGTVADLVAKARAAQQAAEVLSALQPAPIAPAGAIDAVSVAGQPGS